MKREEVLKPAAAVSTNFAHRSYEEDLIEFAQAVASAEREACAKECENMKWAGAGPSHYAHAIRARSSAELKGAAQQRPL